MKTNKCSPGDTKYLAALDQKVEQISLKYRELKTC